MTIAWNRSCVLFFCEERPDPGDVVEGKSAGSGHSNEVGGAEQSVVKEYAQVCDIVTSLTVTERSM